MSPDKALKMGVCTKCGQKFFVSDPKHGPYGGEMRILDAEPPTVKDQRVISVNCPACEHQQFAEFRYGRPV